MNILLIGSGGREHALAQSIAVSPLCARLLIAPGNPGTARCGTNVALDVADHAAVAAFCGREAIDLVVVGPEAPLVAGLIDDLAAAGVKAFGPSRNAARLEGSKAFTKEFAREFGIPTADFACFAEREAAKAHVWERGAPIVVKADGLAAGKGVVVAETLAEADAAIDSLLSTPGSEIVVEERLVGEEASVFALCDGTRILPLGSAKDHKRAFDGDTGPNTGGMGALCPAPNLAPELEREVLDTIVRPTLAGMRDRGAPFVGILYAGVMLTAEGPKLIEFNVRLGDPEAQALLPRLRTDLVALMIAACDGVLDEAQTGWSDFPAVTVVMAARGYPGTYATGSPIRNIAAAEALEHVTVFQAGTAERGGELVANGGRVLAVTALGPTFAEARERAYEAVRLIDWPEGFHRGDIGARAEAG